MIIEQALKEDTVNGDLVSVEDPTDSSLSITLNAVYQRLSKSLQLKYPAPFETVHNIEDHVKIAEKLYLDEKEYLNYKDLEQKYIGNINTILEDKLKEQINRNKD